MKTNKTLALAAVIVCIGGAIAALALTGGSYGGAAFMGGQSAESMPPAQRAAFEQLIREYLLKNPQVIVEAIERNQELASAIGVSGTPAFVIGNRLVPGAIGADALLAIVSQQREQRSGSPGIESKKN